MFKQILDREIGVGRSRYPKYEVVPSRFEIRLQDLVRKHPHFAKGVFLGFDGHGNVLYMFQGGSCVYVEVVLLSPRGRNFECFCMARVLVMSNVGCNVGDLKVDVKTLRGFVCVCVINPSWCSITVFHSSSRVSVTETYSYSQMPTFSLYPSANDGVMVDVCVGTSVNVMQCSLLQCGQEDEENMEMRKCVNKIQWRIQDEHRTDICITQWPSLSVEQLAGQARSRMRAEMTQWCYVDDFNTYVVPRVTSEEVQVAVTIRLKKQTEYVYIWVLVSVSKRMSKVLQSKHINMTDASIKSNVAVLGEALVKQALPQRQDVDGSVASFNISKGSALSLCDATHPERLVLY